MRQTRAAALLWAYDIGSKFGIAWRPRTILLMLGMVAVLGLVPTLALALWVGRLLNHRGLRALGVPCHGLDGVDNSAGARHPGA